MSNDIHSNRNVDDLWVWNKTKVFVKKLKMEIGDRFKVKKSISKV